MDEITKNLGLKPGETPEDLLDELDLNVGPPAPRTDTLERPRLHGRPPTEIHLEYVRDLTEADMAALVQNRGMPPARSLMRIHASHHALARCLATGMKRQQAALVTGYSPERITQLQADPAFQALVADYSAEARATFADLGERMANISLDAIELLQEKLHDDPGSLSVSMLLDIIKSMADRTGFGPGQSVSMRIERGDLIDRPPRESFEEWRARRDRELVSGDGAKIIELKPR